MCVRATALCYLADESYCMTAFDTPWYLYDLHTCNAADVHCASATDTSLCGQSVCLCEWYNRQTDRQTDTDTCQSN